MSKKTLRIGVISLGWMGRLHSRSYKQIKERFPELDVECELEVACDSNPEARRIAIEEIGFKRAVSDYMEVINDPQVDAVSICSPNFLHHPIAMAAIEAGKPFWIEKPMGVNAKESVEIARAAEAKGLVTASGFNYRHTPAIEKLRELVSTGRLGTITNARMWMIADYASSPDGPLTWRYDRSKAGPGTISDLMSHGVDLLHYLLGSPIREVSATTGIFIKDRPIPTKQGVGHTGWEISDRRGAVENEDYCAILARTDSGVLATLESSRVAVGPRAEYIVEVYGTEGSARWNFEHLNDLYVCIGRDNEFQGYVRAMDDPSFPFFSRFQPGGGTSIGFDDMKCVEAAKFIRSIITGEQLAPSAADAALAALIDDAVVESAATKTWTSIAPFEGTTTFAFSGKKEGK